MPVRFEMSWVESFFPGFASTSVRSININTFLRINFASSPSPAGSRTNHCTGSCPDTEAYVNFNVVSSLEAKNSELVFDSIVITCHFVNGRLNKARLLKCYAIYIHSLSPEDEPKFASYNFCCRRCPASLVLVVSPCEFLGMHKFHRCGIWLLICDLAQAHAPVLHRQPAVQAKRYEDPSGDSTKSATAK